MLKYEFLFVMGISLTLFFIVIGAFIACLNYIEAGFKKKTERDFNECMRLGEPEAEDELKRWRSKYVCIRESNPQIIHYGYIFSVNKEFITFLTLSVKEEKSYLGDIALTSYESMMLRRSVIVSISEYDSGKYFKMVNDVLEKNRRNQFPSSDAKTLFDTTTAEETELGDAALLFAL